MEERQMPSTEDVVKKIKDDGDFDALRLKIIRAVKENEELRKNIVDQVKESDVLKQDGSEDMKPRQLSDAIYQELGRKIMGQISDEIWKTIRLNESMRDDIKGTVERVLNKMVSPNSQTGEDSIPFLPPETQIAAREEANGAIKTLITTPASESNTMNANEANESNESPGQRKDSDLKENEQRPALIQNSQELLNQTNKAKDLLPGEADDDSDLPPGFS